MEDPQEERNDESNQEASSEPACKEKKCQDLVRKVYMVKMEQALGQ